MSEFDAKKARAKRPMPIWADAFYRDTQLLETDEVGAYFKLLMAMWSARAVALPDDPKKLARAAGVSTRLWNSRIGPAILGFFSPCDEGITQNRLRKEAAYVERHVTNQSNRKRAENSDKPLELNDLPSTADETADIPADRPTQQPNNPTIDDDGSAHVRETSDYDDFPHPDSRSVSNQPTDRERLLRAIGVNPRSGLTGYGGAMLGTSAHMEVARRWRDDLGLTIEEQEAVIRETMAKKRDGQPPKGFAYFDGPMSELSGAKRADALHPTAPNVTPFKGVRHERRAEHRAFDDTHREIVRRVRAGEIDLGSDDGDPWGGR